MNAIVVYMLEKASSLTDEKTYHQIRTAKLVATVSIILMICGLIFTVKENPENK